jgi:hypothetical protein
VCLNKKVLIPLVVVVAGLLVAPPSWDLAAIPFLVMLVCPLSMLVMIRDRRTERALVMMRDRRTDAAADTAGAARQGAEAGTLSDPAMDERIRELQAELRALKAEQARRAEEAEGTATSYDGFGPVGLDKPAPPAPRS